MRKRLTGAKKTALWLLCSLIAGIVAALLIDSAIRPALRVMAVANAETAANEKINIAVENEITREEYDLDGIITFEKDGEGRINAVKTDIAAANRLKSALALSVLEEIRAITAEEVGVPLGTLSGIMLFSGRGPKISVKIVPVGSVMTDLQSKLINGGINQTLHRLVLDLKVKINVILPREIIPVEVTASVIISETIIVGTVPEYFADIDIPINN